MVVGISRASQSNHCIQASEDPTVTWGRESFHSSESFFSNPLPRSAHILLFSIFIAISAIPHANHWASTFNLISTSSADLHNRSANATLEFAKWVCICPQLPGGMLLHFRMTSKRFDSSRRLGYRSRACLETVQVSAEVLVPLTLAGARSNQSYE